MKKLFKDLIKIGAVAAVFYFGAPLLAVLAVGFVALKGVDVVGGLVERGRVRRAAAGVSPERARHIAAEHRANSRKRFFADGQWEVNNLPLDMYPTRGLNDSREAYFTVAGVRDVVKGRVTGRRGAEFSMVITDERKAQDVMDLIAENGLVGTKVVRRDEGSFSIISDNAVDIATIVKQFYPPRTFEVAREVNTTRQFVVDGCKTYEEALQKFRENRPFFSRPDAVRVSYSNIIDGHAEPEVTSGDSLGLSSLPVGSFVINETVTDYFSRNVTVNGGVDMTDEAMRSDAAEAVVFKHEDKVEDRCSKEPVYSNGLAGCEVHRMMDVDGRQIELVGKDSPVLKDTGASMFVTFASIGELLDVTSGKRDLSGRMVLVDTARYTPNAGEYILEVPAHAALLSSLEMVSGGGRDAAEDAGRYAVYGVSDKDVARSVVVDEIRRNGYVSALLKGPVDYSGALVNGVPVSQYLERSVGMVEDGRLDAFRNEKEQRRWLEAAARVKSVRMDLDLRERRLILTSSVQEDKTDGSRIVTKVEQRDLKENEIRALCSRGRATETELKDLLMRLHPEAFEVYSRKGQSADPMGDFIAGRKFVSAEPRRAKTEAMRQQEARKSEPSVKHGLHR